MNLIQFPPATISALRKLVKLKTEWNINVKTTFIIVDEAIDLVLFLVAQYSNRNINIGPIRNLSFAKFLTSRFFRFLMIRKTSSHTKEYQNFQQMKIEK